MPRNFVFIDIVDGMSFGTEGNIGLIFLLLVQIIWWVFLISRDFFFIFDQVDISNNSLSISVWITIRFVPFKNAFASSANKIGWFANMW